MNFIQLKLKERVVENIILSNDKKHKYSCCILVLHLKKILDFSLKGLDFSYKGSGPHQMI